jgi:hypothetical protein
VCAALIAAGPAAAATPFTAGTGTGHDLAVGGDGTGHVAWLTDESDDRVGYCRVPAGDSACDAELKFLNFPDMTTTADAQGSVQIFAPAANTVVIVATCTQCPTGDTGNNAFRWISTDNGVTFPPNPMPVGELAPSGQGSHFGSGNVMVVTGSQFQAMPSAMAPIGLGGASFTFSASAVPVPGEDKAVYAVNDLSDVKFRVFTDPDADPMAASELNTIGNWGSDSFLSSAEADNEETHLSTGANGVLLSYASSVPGDSRVGLRSFDAGSNAFGAPTYVQGSSAIDQNGLDFPHHSQDGGGRIHFVWRTLHDGGRLRYSRSDGGGAGFSAPVNLATRESFQDPLVEAGSAGTGFAAWRTLGSAIRVVPIDPQPEPSGPSPPGGGGSDTTGPGVGGFGIGDSSLRPGQATSFSFTSSEGGLAVLTIEKRVAGLKLRQRGRTRCLPQTRRRVRQLRRSLSRRADVRRLRGRARRRRLARLLRRRRCNAYKRIGQIRQAVTPGRNTIVFSGRIAGRRLSPGRYRARLVVTDAAGNVSRTETLLFRVVAPRRPRRR